MCLSSHMYQALNGNAYIFVYFNCVFMEHNESVMVKRNISRLINCVTDASITCSFESNFMCGYNHVIGGSQLTQWSAVSGSAGVNEGPTVGTTTGQLSGLSWCHCDHSMRFT